MRVSCNVSGGRVVVILDDLISVNKLCRNWNCRTKFQFMRGRTGIFVNDVTSLFKFATLVGEKLIACEQASLAELRRSDSHSLARRIFFRPCWEPVSRLSFAQNLMISKFLLSVTWIKHLGAEERHSIECDFGDKLNCGELCGVIEVLTSPKNNLHWR